MLILGMRAGDGEAVGGKGRRETCDARDFDQTIINKVGQGPSFV